MLFQHSLSVAVFHYCEVSKHISTVSHYGSRQVWNKTHDVDRWFHPSLKVCREAALAVVAVAALAGHVMGQHPVVVVVVAVGLAGEAALVVEVAMVAVDLVAVVVVAAGMVVEAAADTVVGLAAGAATGHQAPMRRLHQLLASSLNRQYLLAWGLPLPRGGTLLQTF